MGTPFLDPINRFLRRIEEDRDFFQYFQLSDDEALDLARRRARNYLEDAIDRMMMDGRPSVDLTDIDEGSFSFNIELTRNEVFLLSSLMYEYYLDKDISRIKTLNVNYTGTELKVFDPSNARSSFLQLYENVQRQNENLLDTYRNVDRETGEFISINSVTIE
jgi:hypothetical protein|nr:MAG TPA: hypothetical protein [Caudoviricetes sp.]